MVFFITINGGLLVAYCDFKGDSGLILSLGYIAAFLFYCSAKGYHYWTTNFIRRLIDYESRNVVDDNGRVYSAIANKENGMSYFWPLKAANISTFKVVILFAYVLTYAWGILLIDKLIKILLADECIKLLLTDKYPCLMSIELHQWLINLITFVLGIIITFIGNLILIHCLAKRYLKSDAVESYIDLGLPISRTKS
jgi:hypothetical protein